MAKYGVDMYLSAHDHNLQHFEIVPPTLERPMIT